jgi:hypothetical protein
LWCSMPSIPPPSNATASSAAPARRQRRDARSQDPQVEDRDLTSARCFSSEALVPNSLTCKDSDSKYHASNTKCWTVRQIEKSFMSW